jgi:hypothetical protein
MNLRRIFFPGAKQISVEVCEQSSKPNKAQDIVSVYVG